MCCSDQLNPPQKRPFPPPVFTASGVRRNSNRSHKDLDWQGVVDHIAAEIWIVSVWLATLVCSHRTRQQRITAGLCRRDPIVFPAAPCVAAYRVDEIALHPRCAGVEADQDLGNVGVPCPGGTEYGVGATGFEALVDTGACDLRLQFHLGERAAYRCPLGIIPITVVGSLPVALEGLRGCNDVGQPL